MSSSSETTPSGKFANHTGNRLERFVKDALVEYGYTEFWDHKAQAFENRKAIGGKQYMQQLPVGTTIYETVRKADFFVVNKAKFPDDLIIECKWQQSSGSVDEKYPFLLFNIIKTGVPTVILLDGDGYKPSAKKWLQDQMDLKRALIHVWSMTEFHKAVNNGFLG